MKKLYFVIFSVFFLYSCQEHLTERQQLNENFEAWARSQTDTFNSYLVVALNNCAYCSQRTIKLIKEGYFSQHEREAIVLVVRSKADLYPVKEELAQKNVLAYNLQQHKKPIIGDKISLYRYQAPKVVSVREFDVREFEELIDGFSKKLRGQISAPTFEIDHFMEKFSGVVIPGY